jgi:succinylglutamate desuccinylase
MSQQLLVILNIVLLVFLTACSSTPIMRPDRQLVQKALTVQLAQVQQQISQKLHLSSPLQLEIDRLKIKEQKQLKIGNLSAYRVIGTYDRTLQISQRRVTQGNSPFEVYLQLQQEGKTWRLAIPQNNGDKIQAWRTYSIQ